MELFVACVQWEDKLKDDAHLGWTRLLLGTGECDAARRHLEQAREIVESTGYGRRDREVAWLAQRLEEEADLDR